jgi:hypothetical protein
VIDHVYLLLIESRDWTAYNAAQSEEKAHFAVLLAGLCRGVPEPDKVMGRPRLPLSDMVFASAFKVYVGFSSRRFTIDLHEAYADGHIGSTPHFNSVSRYLSDPRLTAILKEPVAVSSLPLKAVEVDFAVDATGFSTCTYERWRDAKYGGRIQKRDWFKAHVMCGVKTNVVTAVDINGRTVHDSRLFVPLLKTTAEHFELSEVSADRAYLSREILDTVELAGATPFIPFKTSTAVPKETHSIWAQM